MTDFLQRVSLMALGLSPVVQPLVVSRYAPDTHLPAPELPPDEQRPFESSAEHAPQPDAQSLSPSRLSTTSEPKVRRVPQQTAASNARQESTQPSSQASNATTEAQPAAPQPADNSIALQSTRINGNVAMPFEEPPVPTHSLLNTEALIEPEPPPVTRPTKEAHVRAAQRQEADTFSANESAPLAHVNEASTQARPGSGAETIERGHSAGDAFTPDMGSEHEFEALELSVPLPPRSDNANSFGQVTTRRADAQLLSSRNDRVADAPQGGVIRITIGRIEVRAVQPPPLQPVEDAAPPAPKLSLDEYLRKHNGRPQ